MKIKGFLKKWFRTDHEEQELVEPKELTPEEQEELRKNEVWKRDPYGFGILNIALCSNDFGWTIDESFKKKVILVNPDEVRMHRVTVYQLSMAFRGTDHYEWEVLIAYAILDACRDALENGNDNANITLAFVRNLLASGGREFPAEKVRKHILRFFDVVSETDNEIRLRIRFWDDPNPEN